ncbi:hypothetical protein LNP17_08150 [Klebsiella variicola subsp. variicola]|nr:hypothetical protein [Klebsiella variicola subsp. variicola]
MAAIKGALTEAGLLAFVVENRIHVVPPCTITAEQVAQGLAIFDAVFCSLCQPGEVGEWHRITLPGSTLAGPKRQPDGSLPPPGEGQGEGSTCSVVVYVIGGFSVVCAPG